MNEKWRSRAACQDVHWSIFYPLSIGDHNRTRQHRIDYWGPAREVCRTCPVRADCLNYALAIDERDGMWGGLAPNERRAYLKVRRAS